MVGADSPSRRVAESEAKQERRDAERRKTYEPETNDAAAREGGSQARDYLAEEMESFIAVRSA